ncbi:metallophosphoesterase domain-containing protein [Rhizobium sp. Kim5]|uniref:metallophosphoesterase n=1 Tax=Rhizobium sp. Kim5 TaxID=2020311 RepID=UPI000A2A3989|nr:metallophosphoesterase [Rhizobium sp. Kim5]ARQ56907.1 metallophosphoesterase domain-containing protein [Rhizobium sp. Kim5]
MSFFRKKFYVADTHFGHDLMLTRPGRPFSSTEEMDEALIDRWNAVVGDNDIVYHLGDFAMGLADEDRVSGVFNRLRGSKVLVLGNHDFKRPNVLHPTLARLDWMTSPSATVETTDEGHRVFLSHYAHRVWPGCHKGSFHFFGHSHGNLPAIGRSRDVGVDCSDIAFAPKTFAELTQGML